MGNVKQDGMHVAIKSSLSVRNDLHGLTLQYMNQARPQEGGPLGINQNALTIVANFSMQQKCTHISPEKLASPL